MVPHPATYSWRLLVSAENSLLTNLKEPHTVLTGGMKNGFQQPCFPISLSAPVFTAVLYMSGKMEKRRSVCRQPYILHLRRKK